MGTINSFPQAKVLLPTLRQLCGAFWTKLKGKGKEGPGHHGIVLTDEDGCTAYHRSSSVVLCCVARGELGRKVLK